jgi:HSP20 family protein
MVHIVKQEDWDTREDLVRLQREMSRLARRSFRPARSRGTRVFPSIIISSRAEELVVRCEVPGMKLEDFDISVSGDTLTVQGTRTTGQEMQGGWYHRRERESGDFSRAVRLPAAVDGDRAEATYVAGVLTITLPLEEPAKPKEIPVRVMEGN